jgi:PIN domain nuclease of toxin-antitoxin system
MMVLDASALIAFVRQEPGAAVVEEYLADGHASAVNASEFIQKLDQHGARGEDAFATLEALGLRFQPVIRADAVQAAAIHPTTRPYGLAIADRLCLALALRLGLTVCSADTSWAEPAKKLGIKLQLIR